MGAELSRMVQKTESSFSSRFSIVEIEHTLGMFSKLEFRIIWGCEDNAGNFPRFRIYQSDQFGIELSNTTAWRYARKLDLIPNVPRETGYVRKE